MAVTGNAAAEYSRRMHPAADNGRIDADGQQERGRDSAIAHTQRSVGHLCKKTAEQHHEKYSFIQLLRVFVNVSSNSVKWNVMQHCTPHQCNKESEQAPFYDLLPL